MNINLHQILSLVGKLDDAPGDDTARERFRRFLKDNVLEVGQVRDHIEECLRTSGDEYSRALQDLAIEGLWGPSDYPFGSSMTYYVGREGTWRSPKIN